MLNFIKATQCDKINLQINDDTESKIKEYLNDEKYNLYDDLDENENNVLHCLAENS